MRQTDAASSREAGPAPTCRIAAGSGRVSGLSDATHPEALPAASRVLPGCRRAGRQAGSLPEMPDIGGRTVTARGGDCITAALPHHIRCFRPIRCLVRNVARSICFGSRIMRGLSMSARDELPGALRRRYGEAERSGKSRMPDEFVSVTGHHRKHAIRLLRGSASTETRDGRSRRFEYGDEIRDALVVLREAPDRICGKRLQVLLPSLVEAMERHGHPELREDVRAGVPAMSAATIDRRLRDIRKRAGSGARVHGGRSGRAQRSGRMRELSANAGHHGRRHRMDRMRSGSVREQTLVRESLARLRRRLPFDLPGFDVDNDSVFMNETLPACCEESGRSRPWHRNDQALVERKNGSVVRRLFVNLSDPRSSSRKRPGTGPWSGNATTGRQHRAGGCLKMPAHPGPYVTRSPSCRNAWAPFFSCSRCDAGSRR